MAVVKTILKKTAQEAVVKVAGSDGSVVISLANDLLPASQALTVGGTPTVNIVGAHWTGAAGSTIRVIRVGDILTIPADQPTQFDFEGLGFVDTINNTTDITVTLGAVECQIYLILRKVDGYSTKVETAQFGIYDNETVVGS